MERELGTQNPDMPHAFEPSITAPVVCAICQHSVADRLHQEAPERAFSDSKPGIETEKGS